MVKHTILKIAFMLLKDSKSALYQHYLFMWRNTWKDYLLDLFSGLKLRNKKNKGIKK